MKFDSISSERLAILRFPLIVGVVFIHAYGSEVTLLNKQVGSNNLGVIPQYIQNFLSQGLARLAVPLFFLLAGYFFFLGLDWSIHIYKNQIRKRLKSLFIPFLIWNILTLLGYMIIQEIPLTASLLSGEKQNILSFNISDYFNAIFGFTRSPISYQFWFIRDLMIVSLISPAIYFLIRKFNYIFILPLLILWFVNHWPLYIPSMSSVLFFSLGSMCAINNYSLFQFDKIGQYATIAYFLILTIDSLNINILFFGYLHKFGILIGLVSVLYLSGCVQQLNNIKNSLLNLSISSFFVFAFHEPILMTIKKTVYKFAKPESDISIILIYFACPITVISISILVYRLLNKYYPRITLIITGGR